MTPGGPLVATANQHRRQLVSWGVCSHQKPPQERRRVVRVDRQGRGNDSGGVRALGVGRSDLVPARLCGQVSGSLRYTAASLL